ncbi:KAP-like P-loop domain-containing protein [Chitinophaga polysaccharea]|uniref:KAP-like P-loop domain-containing protein n=1 Tax=Chitinophaga polysaccharea TaxID=1293035 RepID=A0A561PN88_9BACT|nr:P-loop NTPase fold protein [Chitinophaga polysaccharea]TWF39579.1 KAP-like P-loop domain-containing protein [Chitinophaga polysaccharea]
MAVPYYKEIFEYPIAEFTKHLELEFNERIFFSGKYGTGKTTFLKKYFEQSDIKEKYEQYHLFPVNYSISSNEDIIRYIKYDIILTMLERHDTFAEEGKSYLKDLPAFMLKNMDKVLEAIIAMVPVVGKNVLEMYEKLGALKDKYLAYAKENSKGDGEKLIEYLNLLEGQSGSLMENDIITKIISERIKFSSPKKSVLIVDDLDRLDPEHIFRILNIFAAHFDTKASTRGPNKLGFDKVIIVGDIENIRNIFHHRYGLLTDFAGYIDKFYSADIYYFDNRLAVSKIVNRILYSYTVDGDNKVAGRVYLDDRWIGGIITHLIEKGDLSLRAILNTHGKELSYHIEVVDLMVGNLTDAHRVPLIYKLKYLTELLGSTGKLITILKKFSNENITLQHIRLPLGSLLYILNYRLIEKNADRPFLLDHGNQKFFIEEQRDFYSHMITEVEIYKSVPSGETDQFSKGEKYYGQPREFWELCIQVVNHLTVLGYLR